MTSNEPQHQFVEIDGTRYDFGTKDWTYLSSNKTPDSNHELQAAVITQLSGVEISPEQCMAFLAMHRFIQKSEANQQRQGYRGRTVESVVKGAATLQERLAERGGDMLVTPVVGTVVEPEPEAPKPAARRRRAPATKKAEKATA